MVNSSILSWVVYENIQNQFEFVSNRLKEYCIYCFDSVMKTRAKFVRTGTVINSPMACIPTVQDKTNGILGWMLPS